MKPKLVERGAFNVVGMCGIFTKKSAMKEIGKLWDRFGPRIDEVPNKAEAWACYGVCFGDQTLMTKPGADFFYMPAVEVRNLRKIPADMVGKTVPAGRYAVFTVKDGLTGIGPAYRYAYETWLPKSKHRPAPAPDFELYDDRFDPETGKGAIEIWIPIEDRP